MKKYFSFLIAFLLILGCQKQEQKITEPEVVFSILEVDPLNEKSANSWDCPTDEDGYLLESAYAEIVIDQQTYYPLVYRLDGRLYTQSIKLVVVPGQTNTFTVTKFLLRTEDGTIVMANPEKSSEYADYVSEAVPFTFQLDQFSKSETPVDVICFLPEDYLSYGFEWFSVDESVIREKCFFGDICIDPADYVGSDYENQSTGLKVDVPALISIVVKKDGVEVENSPFTNASADMNWGVGQPLCVEYPDDLNVSGEEFTFEMSILIADGPGDFGYQWFYTFTAVDDGPLDVADINNDGILNFVLGDCNYNDPDHPTIDLELSENPSPMAGENTFANLQGDATCFRDLQEIETNRWGWTNGPFTEDVKPYHFKLYSRENQCGEDESSLVGMVTVYYVDHVAEITYTMVNGDVISGINLYAGNEVLPRNSEGEYTVTPSQYPYVNNNVHDQEAFSVSFSGLSGAIYVVAHANVKVLVK